MYKEGLFFFFQSWNNYLVKIQLYLKKKKSLKKKILNTFKIDTYIHKDTGDLDNNSEKQEKGYCFATNHSGLLIS